ncbi:MAG: AIR synthase-related protein [Chloroflexota bacterium]|nr:AIR synthase-related protein [Chloroflexota bacterium]
MSLPTGKLPLPLLRQALGRVPRRDPAVLVGAEPGEDAAVIDVGGPELLVAAADPITFAAADIGTYLLAVNGNDLAVMGAEPRWLLATVLAPAGTTATRIQALLDDVAGACAAANVALVGGHTEITDSVTSPVVAGTLLGTVAHDSLIRTAGARPGDALLLAGEIAVEGTAILAGDHADTLRRAGVSEADIQIGAARLQSPGISVRPAAEALRTAAEVHAMHDPTEGGLAAALHELAEAAEVGVVVDRDAVPVLPECRRICRALGLDPYALLASGALLASLPAARAPAAVAALQRAGLAAAVIGDVTAASEGRRWTVDGKDVPIPTVERDELARFLESA